MPGEEKNMRSVTIHTYLGTSEDTAYTKLVPIKSFPQLGGAPDLVDITDLDDNQEKTLLGVQSLDQLEFSCNYTSADYDKVAALADGTIRKFCVAFGKKAEYGIFTWEGQINVAVSGGGVNDPREMTIYISAATKITKDGGATFNEA